MFCYGKNGIIDSDKVNEECNVLYGYSIITEQYGDCNKTTIKEVLSDFNERVVFNVPVRSVDRVNICPGKLEVFI